MDTQTRDKVRQLVAQALVAELEEQQWEPYPQPGAWAMQWDADGLDYALRRNGHRPPANVSDDERVLKR